ncbi:protein SPT2 homolog [Anneissia japonica]|uniref:protein SPT2 homolog n=1 Tax=Anneissia japonica TaxID=1529436 RepID=UPI0014255BC4|nr:protein SPT2 homolog [Anneissia japonica]
MNIIDKGADRKKERTECERPIRPETSKKKPIKQPMNFKELMDLAKRKQNGEVIIDKTTAKSENVDVKKQTSSVNSSSKKNTNFDTQKHEFGKKVKKVSDSKISHELGNKVKKVSDSKIPHDSAKVKLKNGHTKVLESQEKGKVVKGRPININMNTSKVPDTKGNDLSSGKASGLKKSSVGPAIKDKAKSIHPGSGQTKPKLPPQQRSQVSRVPMKRTAPPPKLKAKRGRLCSEDEEDEDDDFIDDTGEDVDVSKYIRQIFGYDKRNYGYESEYALNNMEASYTQIMKEEARSTRLGITEDLEDMRKEKMDLARKKAKSKR